ncbi:MAG: right-handed parallel beta-helix repeat-containing protein [Sandaracinaceae bacterium]|nr:right-handed parallel beta-helix repeat-containing protein [Sandaracinaceae bacterium]
MRTRSMLVVLLALSLVGCDEAVDPDAGAARDGGGVGSDGGADGPDAAPRDGGGTAPDAAGADAGVSECDDGIDNDGDGLVDWQRDLGCWGPGDRTEAARPRDEEAGFTTFDVGTDSVVVYVAKGGDDGNDGATPETAVATLARAAELVRDGENDFVLLHRGDTWRDPVWPRRFLSGRDATHPMVIASYGDSTERPRLELGTWFINHDGQARSFVAITGLHFVGYQFDPDDPGFTGEGDGALRYVGGGEHLLVEDCHLEYAELVVQSCCGESYADVEVRRNVVEKAYHAGTCSPGDPNGDPTFRPSGMYSSHVERLTIEGNLFDHNGWNEDVATACATIYNHNLYLNGHDVVIRDNLLTRASSIHIKLRSDTTGDMSGLVVENNFFVEGEIGVSLGGNTTEPGRFSESTVRRNVMSDIGRSRPTTRSLAWGLDVSDNDGLSVTQNLFLDQHEMGVGNSYALNLAGGTANDVVVEDNLFYRIQRTAIRARPTAGHSAIRVAGNDLVDPDQDSCLVDHDGPFGAYRYADNRYQSSADDADWFCTASGRASLEEWQTASGETGASRLPDPGFPDPDRTVETYAESLGLAPTLDAFLAAARQQSRLTHRPELGAPALNDYVRAGFGR